MGVTANCKECGFQIYDEQTRLKLCDVCEKLPPDQRPSAVRERTRLEIERRVALAEANPLIDWGTNVRVGVRTAPRRDDLGELRQRNAQLLKEVEELRRQLAASEIEEENVPEVTSFLRRFDNLQVEGEF